MSVPCRSNPYKHRRARPQGKNASARMAGRGLLLANLPSFPRDPDRDTIRFWPSESNTPFIALPSCVFSRSPVYFPSAPRGGWTLIARNPSRPAGRSTNTSLKNQEREQCSVWSWSLLHPIQIIHHQPFDISIIHVKHKSCFLHDLYFAPKACFPGPCAARLARHLGASRERCPVVAGQIEDVN